MIRLAKNLVLPDEAVTETFAFLAKKGAGKTYSALKMAEGFAKANHQIIYCDPIGVCWGLRSSADGKKPGIPIVIFGGAHADVPLEKEAGSVIADIAIEERLSILLDLSLLRKGEQKRFMLDFADTLYHKNRNPLHLFIDESDLYAPQRPMPGDQQMLGAVEDLVRRGRARGIGISLITQRPAVLNKDVLSQIEALIVLRMTSPHDQAAIEAWIKLNGTDEERRKMMGSLASLPRGTAWFWSPGWLEKFIKIEISRRETFDSSSTPKAGDIKRTPKVKAEIDLAALGQKIQATIERAKSEDPRELKKQITELRRQIATLEKQKAAPAGCNHESDIRALEDQIAILRSRNDNYWKIIEDIESTCKSEIPRLYDYYEKIIGAIGLLRSAKTEIPKIKIACAPSAGKPERPAPLVPTKRTAGASGNYSGKRNKKELILDALLAFEDIRLLSVPRAMLSVWAETTPSSSAFRNNLSALKSQDGFIEYCGNGHIRLTETGRAAAILSKPLSNLEEYHNAWYHAIHSGKKADILRVLIVVYPHDISREELAPRAGTSLTSSAFRNNLSSLRTLQALDYTSGGGVVATDYLFPEGLR